MFSFSFLPLSVILGGNILEAGSQGKKVMWIPQLEFPRVLIRVNFLQTYMHTGDLQALYCNVAVSLAGCCITQSSSNSKRVEIEIHHLPSQKT